MSFHKVLLLTSEFPPQPGGIGNHAFHLAKGLQGHEHSVTVICDDRSKTGKEEEVFDAAADFNVIRTSRKTLALIKYFKRIQIAVSNAHKNDTIIASGKFSLWLAAFLSLFFQKKYIAVIHGSEVQLSNSLLKWITNGSLKRFHKVIAVSHYTKSLVSELNLKNIQVIPNGFSLEHTFPVEEEKSPVPVLITVGNVTQRKGQHNVIKALPILLENYPDLKYHIVGIPTEKEKLQQLLLRLGVEKSVVFHGKVTETKKIKMLQDADVFIMLSEITKTGDAEGFGIAILEANSLGIPAIGAKGCGIEDAIKNGYSGKLIENDNPQQCKEALQEILSNYEVYSEGAKNWSQNFTWDKIIQSYLTILERNDEKITEPFD
ncbi:glycosyltransferase family 4 protein [Marixanthomonas ophiurae]|uniref:Glycosyltransferase family 1 protein n=1 Tax=Marixanthomonas ophiurae TaxID=387659 RepID=A0A3E1QD37_9FLAO|nr:glycosyltransferase family 4 protein [Marixanthomonas ophiurae]RFN60058.1 glycosyltransferase family 1 protein [Marixanthomonas ophiurae]